MFTSESTVGFAVGSPINRASLLGGCEFCLVFELMALSLGSCSVELTLDKDLFRVCRQSANSAIRFTDVCDFSRSLISTPAPPSQHLKQIVHMPFSPIFVYYIMQVFLLTLRKQLILKFS